MVLHVINTPLYGPKNIIQSLTNMPLNVFVLFCFSIIISSCGGIIIATILKNLDNIVKEYSGSMANVLTAVICSIFFPKKFQVGRKATLTMFLNI